MEGEGTDRENKEGGAGRKRLHESYEFYLEEEMRQTGSVSNTCSKSRCTKSHKIHRAASCVTTERLSFPPG